MFTRIPFGANRVARPLSEVLLLYVVPVLGAPEKLTSPVLLSIASLYFILDLFQPALRCDRGDHRTDRGSLGLLLATAVAAQLLPIVEWAYFSNVAPNRFVTIVGATLVAAGGALRIWAIVTLGRFFSARVELQQEHRLVREGPYRWIRHPSYAGALLFLLGVPVLLHTPISLGVALCALTIGYAHRIPTEERLLRGHFGEAFIRYERETKRLIPLIW